MLPASFTSRSSVFSVSFMLFRPFITSYKGNEVSSWNGQNIFNFNEHRVLWDTQDFWFFEAPASSIRDRRDVSKNRHTQKKIRLPFGQVEKSRGRTTRLSVTKDSFLKEKSYIFFSPCMLLTSCFQYSQEVTRRRKSRRAVNSLAFFH